MGFDRTLSVELGPESLFFAFEHSVAVLFSGERTGFHLGHVVTIGGGDHAGHVTVLLHELWCEGLELADKVNNDE